MYNLCSDRSGWMNSFRGAVADRGFARARALSFVEQTASRSCSLPIPFSEEAIRHMKLYVGNLSFDTNETDLNELFSRSGTVESCRIITERETGRSRGFGFVEMSTSGEAQRAIQQFDGHDLKGRALKVNEARERESGGGGGGWGRR